MSLPPAARQMLAFSGAARRGHTLKTVSHYQAHISCYQPEYEAEMQRRAELRESENWGLRPGAGWSHP